jgi:hypothetical protein
MSQVFFNPFSGAAQNIALPQLDSSGQISGAMIPDDFDDVQRFPSVADFPNPGVVARIYFSADNNVPHRWDPETLSYIPIVADSDGGEF